MNIHQRGTHQRGLCRDRARHRLTSQRSRCSVVFQAITAPARLEAAIDDGKNRDGTCSEMSLPCPHGESSPGDDGRLVSVVASLTTVRKRTVGHEHDMHTHTPARSSPRQSSRNNTCLSAGNQVNDPEATTEATLVENLYTRATPVESPERRVASISVQLATAPMTQARRAREARIHSRRIRRRGVMCRPFPWTGRRQETHCQKTLVAEKSQLNMYTRHADHTVTAETSPQVEKGRAPQQGERRTSRDPIRRSSSQRNTGPPQPSFLKPNTGR